MVSEQSKAIVLRFCEYLSNRQLEELFAMMHDDASWTTVGDPARFAFGGKKDKATMLNVLMGFLKPMDTFSFTVDSIVAEGGEVAIEATSHGTGPGARRYDNLYILKFVLVADKIQSINEFFDQSAVLEYVAQPA